MMRNALAVGLLSGVCASGAACSSGVTGEGDSAQTSGGASSGPEPGSTPAQGSGSIPSASTAASEPGVGSQTPSSQPPKTEPVTVVEEGRFGVPQVTFTLPSPAGELGELYYPDLKASFPDVDFDTLERLYIPAGSYRSVLLGGLPQRAAATPLVITNLGGQVRVGGDAANYVFVIKGGRNWVLTGRYDAVSMTGDPSYPGHANGQYAHSQGTYGIVIDDAFSKAGLSGLSVGGGASDFEIEMLEVTRAEFAGITAKTDDDGQATMRNVSLHDTYVHDVGSEGIYFGSTQAQPQHTFENLHIYANRFVRTGTEALQVGQLGDGAEVHHNVLGPAALRWRSAFQPYQDGNVQYGQRHGSSSFHHNVVIGTGDLFVEFFPQSVVGDEHGAADTVTFSNNYFSDTSSSGVYTHADSNAVSVVFEDNIFRGFYFNYDEVYPDATAPNQVFGVGSNTENPTFLLNNRFDAPIPFVEWTFASTTTAGNTAESLMALEFVDFMGADIDANVRRLEWWTDRATLSPDQRAVQYPEGAFVMHNGVLYRAKTANQGKPPDSSFDAWEMLPPPADDARVAKGSVYAPLGFGLP